MKKFIKHHKNPNADRINMGIMTKSHDTDLVQYIVDACKSLEVVQHIKFISYAYEPDEHKIDFNDYITTRRKKVSDEKYILLEDSRYGELTLEFELNCKGEVETISKKMLIPKVDEDGYYFIKGKKFFLLYQLVDSSTYTTKSNITLKSLMPIAIKRDAHEVTDIDGVKYSIPHYIIYIFKKEVDILLFYFVSKGFKATLKFFSVDKIINFVTDVGDTEKNIYFQVSSKISLEVNREFFNEHNYVQGIVSMILSVVNNRFKMENLEDKNYWTEKLGSVFASNNYNYYEKGLNSLTFFNRMLDETTKRILKIDYGHRKDIYSVVRWLIQNYNELKKKNNLDLNNKRLRCNEFIASLLTVRLSKQLNRVISLGSKLTIDRLKDVFKFKGDILLTQLFKSGLLRFDDIVNDICSFMWRHISNNPFNCGNILRA